MLTCLLHHQVAFQVPATGPQVLAVLDDLQQQLEQEEDDASCAGARIFRESLVLATRRVQAGRTQKSWATDSLLPLALLPSFAEEEEGYTSASTKDGCCPCTSSALLRRFRAHSCLDPPSCASVTPSNVHVGGEVPHALTAGSDPVHVVVAEATVRSMLKRAGGGRLAP